MVVKKKKPEKPEADLRSRYVAKRTVLGGASVKVKARGQEGLGREQPSCLLKQTAERPRVVRDSGDRQWWAGCAEYLKLLALVIYPLTPHIPFEK